MFNSFAAALTSLAGLATGDGSEPDQPNLIWGQLGALVVICLAIWRLRRLPKLPRDVLVTLAGAIFLVLIFAVAQDAYLAYGADQVRAATSSRYQLPTAVLVLLVFGNLLKDVKVNRWALGVAGVLAVFAISGGVQLMIDEAHERWEPAAAYTRATLSGIELSAPDDFPGRSFRPGTSFDVPVEDYLAAVAAHGSPAFSEVELRGQEPPFRLTADASLIDATGVEVTGNPPSFANPLCRNTVVSRTLELKPDGYSVVNLGQSELALSVARFSDPPGILLGSVLPDATAGLTLPRGSSRVPWTMSFAGSGPVRVCLQTPVP